MKVLVTGSSGQLGSEIREQTVKYPHYEFVFADRSILPMDDSETIISYLNSIRPDAIINAAAYTAVDRAEGEQLLADLVNNQAVALIANWCAEKNVRLIHISTDYVFPGDSATPLTEDAPTCPINVYGLTKLLGEQAVLKSGTEFGIIRTAWVYSTYGNNFVKTMIRLMNERDEINVIEDQIGSPTYARDLASASLKLLFSESFESGVYHYSNEGRISWYDFAVAIRDLMQFDCKINPIPSSSYPTAAKRPHYSLLDKSKIKRAFGVAIPDWEQSLEQMLDELKNKSK